MMTDVTGREPNPVTAFRSHLRSGGPKVIAR